MYVNGINLKAPPDSKLPCKIDIDSGCTRPLSKSSTSSSNHCFVAWLRIDVSQQLNGIFFIPARQNNENLKSKNKLEFSLWKLYWSLRGNSRFFFLRFFNLLLLKPLKSIYLFIVSAIAYIIKVTANENLLLHISKEILWRFQSENHKKTRGNHENNVKIFSGM